MMRRGLKIGMTHLLVGFVKLYQWLLAPVLGTNCRFEPSCSRYAVEALQRHGPWRGIRLSVGRILRCQPWGGNGFDPVPDVDANHCCSNHAPSVPPSAQ